MKNQALFSKNLLDDVLSYQNSLITDQVDSIPKDQFLNTPDEKIIEHLESKFRITPLTLYEDKKTMEQSEVEVDVSHDRARNPSRSSGPLLVKGIKIVVSIPYSGDEQLWDFAPARTFVFNYGNARKRNSDGIGFVDIVYEQPIDKEPLRIKTFIDEQINGIKSTISSQNQKIQTFNDGLRSKIEQSIRVRKERLNKYDDIVDFIGIPLKKRDGIPEYRKIDILKRVIKPLPAIPKDGYKPEPGISLEDYEYILNIIRHEGRTYESTPKTFSVHEEEELRDILVAHLNGHFHGGATGETFRKKGKTDIRIEDNDRAAFVGECKIWYGEKQLFEAIDQLLGYLTWRDCKAALIVFNKHNTKFSNILKTIPEAILTHKHFIKEHSHSSNGEWRYLFESEEDENRHILLHVFVFNIFYKTK